MNINKLVWRHFWRDGVGAQVYLLPLSQKQKESVLQRKLVYRTLLAFFAVTLICAALLLAGLGTYYSAIISISYVTYLQWVYILMGGFAFTEKSDEARINQRYKILRRIYQVVLFIQWVPLVQIFDHHISSVEFWAIIITLIVVNLPFGVALRRRWPLMRGEIVTYENRL